MATIRKSQNSIWEVRDDQGNWFKDQKGNLQVINKEFYKRVALLKLQVQMVCKPSFITKDRILSLSLFV